MEDDLEGLEWFDYSTLTQINECSVKGILLGHHRKTMVKRESQAIKAGTAMHEVFAAANLFKVLKYEPDLNELVQGELIRLIGNDRAELAIPFLGNIDKLCFNVLETSAFEDNEFDEKRTRVALEETTAIWCSNFNLNDGNRVWVSEDKKKTGVESRFAFKVSFMDKRTKEEVRKPIAFVGVMDLLERKKDNSLRVTDYKTSSKLSGPWEDQLRMSHQLTGYCIYASIISNELVEWGKVEGVQIPMPVRNPMNGIKHVGVLKDERARKEWGRWLVGALAIFDLYKDKVTEAPQQTHSCTNFFTPCQFLSFCQSEDEDKVQMINGMEDYGWNPLKN